MSGCAWRVLSPRRAGGELDRIALPAHAGAAWRSFCHEVGHHVIGFDRYKKAIRRGISRLAVGPAADALLGVEPDEKVLRAYDLSMRLCRGQSPAAWIEGPARAAVGLPAAGGVISHAKPPNAPAVVQFEIRRTTRLRAATVRERTRDRLERSICSFTWHVARPLPHGLAHRTLWRLSELNHCRRKFHCFLATSGAIVRRSFMEVPYG